ncbi:hypothetical protein OSB04_019274 [Centaurea solstitialis]|uniref:HAT C-terminal dimerisation domain-containing protein n=1 Tax=Centaurea solstitialis TaxID=347529 RepID=A0AA38T1I3_9ASTR|nr:hypothetical protein OSB04_019274 [Centaurea solstitialis]
MDDRNEFDVLRWWKVDSERFPILSKMARDLLVVPISTVASESTFTTSGSVLDSFSSSLTPKIVQALVYTQEFAKLRVVGTSSSSVRDHGDDDTQTEASKGMEHSMEHLDLEDD